MNITKKLIKVFVLPEHGGRQNVVRRVHWIVVFEDDGHSSVAFAETFLDVDALQDFIPANEVGTERVLDWAFQAQGGDAYIAEIQPYHAEQIAYNKMCAGQTEFRDGFEFHRPMTQTNIPADVL